MMRASWDFPVGEADVFGANRFPLEAVRSLAARTSPPPLRRIVFVGKAALGAIG